MIVDFKRGVGFKNRSFKERRKNLNIFFLKTTFVTVISYFVFNKIAFYDEYFIRLSNERIKRFNTFISNN